MLHFLHALQRAWLMNVTGRDFWLDHILCWCCQGACGEGASASHIGQKVLVRQTKWQHAVCAICVFHKFKYILVELNAPRGMLVLHLINQAFEGF